MIPYIGNKVKCSFHLRSIPDVKSKKKKNIKTNNFLLKLIISMRLCELLSGILKQTIEKINLPRKDL